jgi:hypothetical protein
VVDKVALGQVVSEYFGVPCQFSFNRLLHTHHLSSGVGTIGQIVADVPTSMNHDDDLIIFKVSYWKVGEKCITLQYPQEKVTTTNGNGSLTTLFVFLV